MVFNYSSIKQHTPASFNTIVNEKEMSVAPRLFIRDYWQLTGRKRPQMNRKIQIGSYLVSYTPNNRNRNIISEDTQNYKKELNLQILRNAVLQSFKGEVIPIDFIKIKTKIDPLLSCLPFEKCKVNYNPFDECWNYDLFFDNDVRLNLGVFDDFEEDGIDFIVYHADKYLIANRLPLPIIIERTEKALARVSHDLANL